MLLSNERLSKVCEKYGFLELQLDRDDTTKFSPHTKATIIEALLGAIYLDGGMPAVRQVASTLGLLDLSVLSLPPADVPQRPSLWRRIKTFFFGR